MPGKTSIDSLKAAIKNSPLDTNLIFKYADLMRYYYNNDPVEGIEIANEAIRLSKELNFNKGLAILHNQKGMCYSYQKSLDSSKSNYVISADYFSKDNNFFGLSSALGNIGVLYKRTGKLDSAIKYLFDSYRISRSKNIISLKQSNLINLGNIFLSIENHERSFKYFSEALEMHNEILDTFSLADIYHNLSQTRMNIETADQAIAYLDSSLYFYNYMNVTSGRALVFVSLARAYSLKNDFAKSFNFIDSAKNEFQKLNWDEDAIVHLNLTISDVFFHKGKYTNNIHLIDSSIAYAFEAERHLTPLAQIDMKFQPYELLYENYKLLENDSLAYHYLNLSRNIQDSLNQVTLINNIASLLMQENESFYNRDIEVLEEKENNSKIILYFTITASIILLLIVTLLIFIFRKKYKIEKHIKETTLNSNKKLETTLEKEKNLVHRKSTFLSIITHEFKNPLQVISTNLELLEIRSNLDENTSKNLNRINHSVKKLKTMVDEVILLEKSDFKSEKLIYSDIRIDKLVNEIIDENPFRVEKSITFDLNIFENLTVNNHYETISIILNNLISNSIKYSNRNSKVEIESKMINNNFFFKIQDYGIGIPQKDQEFLFNAFHRAQNSKAIPGTGLGLNIISTLIQNSGGTIEFTSVENEGSTFIINLPLN